MSWRRFFSRAARARERDDEMRAHLALYTEELIARGRTPEQAAREARLAFGNPRVKLEEVDRMNALPVFDVLGRDVRYAFRVMRRTPAFTATAIVTLALVIGACTAVFTLADAILLRPLPYPQPERLAYVERWIASYGRDGAALRHDGLTWEMIRDRVPSLHSAAYGSSFGSGVNLVVGEATAIVRQQRVSADYFSVLGVPPRAGRSFTADEDRPGGPPAVVLSDRLWRTTFGGDGNIVGKGVLLRGEPYTVVGIMPSDFINIDEVDVWTPLQASQRGEGGGTNFGVIARPKPGVTIDRAEMELLALGQEPFRNLQFRSDLTALLGLRPMQDALVEGVREPIVMLGAAVGVVLLIACVNLAALLLARGGSRAKEIATRMALGSGRRAVVRQLMIEALVLALAGGALGILAGQLILQGLQAIGGQTFAEWERVALDWRALVVTIGLAGATSLVFGLVPAVQASRLNVNAALGESGSRSIAGAARHWPRRLLVVTEVALGVVLLVTAGLLVRTFVELQRLDPGFNPRGLTTASVSLLDARYTTGEQMHQLFERSLDRLSRAPGVQSAAVSLGLPYERLLNLGFRFVDAADDQGRTTNATYVAGDLFGTMEIPLRRGRLLTAADRETTAPVAVVNESFARFYSKERDVVGRRIRMSGGEREIVGVVGNVQQRGSGFYLEGMTDGPLTSPPLVYVPASQAIDAMRGVHVWFSPVWVVRARSTGEAATAVRDAISSVDPLLPVGQARAMTDVMARATAEQRLLMTLVGVLAAAALLLAAIGIHGLISHSVAERRRELGIRLALGATVGRTIRGIALGGVALAAIGAVAGGLLSLAAVRLVQSFLWNVGERDPLTFTLVVLFVLVVSAVASVIPALRILKLDPAQTLRA
jgi:predicted permease